MLLFAEPFACLSSFAEDEVASLIRQELDRALYCEKTMKSLIARSPEARPYSRWKRTDALGCLLNLRHSLDLPESEAVCPVMDALLSESMRIRLTPNPTYRPLPFLMNFNAVLQLRRDRARTIVRLLGTDAPWDVRALAGDYLDIVGDRVDAGRWLPYHVRRLS